jgi:hypothetical protein
MNDYQLDLIARSYAEDIVSELKEYGGDAIELAHQYADGCEHVIYYSKAHRICQNCDVSNGEDFVEGGFRDVSPTYDELASHIVYGELYYRIVRELSLIQPEALL